jgi:hypothetical protein
VSLTRSTALLLATALLVPACGEDPPLAPDVPEAMAPAAVAAATLAAPTNLVAKANSPTAITLTWLCLKHI